MGAILKGPDSIVSLGGGALLDEDNRRQVEAAGAVICLSASQETLVKRLAQSRVERPLLQPVQGKSGDRIAAVRQNLEKLLAERAVHYHSFLLQLNTDSTEVSELVFAAQTLAGAFRVTGMGAVYDVRVVQRGLDSIGAEISQRGLSGPVVIVSDENVASLYGEQVLRSLEDSGLEGSLFADPGRRAVQNPGIGAGHVAGIPGKRHRARQHHPGAGRWGGWRPGGLCGCHLFARRALGGGADYLVGDGRLEPGWQNRR